MNIWEYRPFTDDNANIVIIGDKASTQHPEAMVETMKEAVAMDIRLILSLIDFIAKPVLFPGAENTLPPGLWPFLILESPSCDASILSYRLMR